MQPVHLLKKFLGHRGREQIPFAELFKRFQDILDKNNAAMELIADMDGKMGGDFVFDRKYLTDSVHKLKQLVLANAYDLNFITNNQFLAIYDTIEKLAKELEIELSGQMVIRETRRIYHLNEIDEGMEDTVGYKAYNLSRMVSLPKIDFPEGFVAAIGCFRDYLAYNNLFEKIASLIETFKKEEKSVESVSTAIGLMILGGDIPPNVRREILNAANKICKGKVEGCYFSVRSSGVGEDGELSFAGLHDSFLNVRFGELLSAFKKVLASLYNPASLSYRLKMNLFQMEMAMPVLYQAMVPSRTAGVLYTLDPNNPDRPECILSGNWGLGRVVVEGQAAVDTFYVSRNTPHAITQQKIGSKKWMLAPLKTGQARKVPGKLRDKPCLSPLEARTIVEAGLILERFFKKPLDVEWSLDEGGRLWILQARPLKIQPAKRVQRPELSEVLKRHRVLLEERGMIAYRGIGAGPARLVTENDDLSQFPAGSVLVSRYAPPRLAEIIPRASAIITDIGTTTGHMATVAREFRVPTIVGTEIATQVLEPDQLVTVDAERNIIYEGRIEELLHHQLLEESAFEVTREFQVLRRILKKIAPLYLTDPNAPNFTPRGCRTFHDIMRFIHEKAFQALLQTGSNPRAFLKRGGKRLKSQIPIDLILIDLGGGISQKAAQQTHVSPDQITSVPMQEIWAGLSSPGTWNMDPIPVDFKGMMSSVTRTRSSEVMGNSLPGVNLGVLGADYVNLSLPLGYHFTVVEAAVGPKPENNYISFRFAGGVTDITRRSRRASLLKNILEKAGFKVNVNGDMVNARAIDLTDRQIRQNLHLIGRLIGFTRQLDVLLKNDADIERYLAKFINQAVPPEKE